MRLIDADAYKKYLDNNWIVANHDAIDAQPTIDAVEVVRCKDCKWIRKAGTLMGENPEPIYGCYHTGVYVFEDGYCDVGERKEE